MEREHWEQSIWSKRADFLTSGIMDKIKEWWPLLATLAGMMAVPLVIAGIYITSANRNIASLIDAQNRSIEEQLDSQNHSDNARYEGLMERFEGLKE